MAGRLKARHKTRRSPESKDFLINRMWASKGNEHKKFYRVIWPDGAVELVAAGDDTELFMILDEDNIPLEAQIEEVEISRPMRIIVRNAQLSLVNILRLPAKRKLGERDIRRILAEIYGDSPTPLYFH